MVNKPPHYQLEGLDIEALDVIRAVLNKAEYKGYLVGNCLKYGMRASKKNGDEDYKKLAYYAEELKRILNDSA